MGIRYAILGLLNYEDLHGYRIKEHIERNFGHMWSINYGQIYQNLKRLEDEGLVKMVEVAQSENGGPRKKLYCITEEGRAEFSRWLASSPDRQMLLRDPFLTRFVFFDFGDPEDALRLIDEQIESYERQLDRRRENTGRWKQYGTYVRLTSELGVEFNEMYLGWLKRARGEVERRMRAGAKAWEAPPKR
ncbi:MAG: PadR family transcriptional regulator [Actinobacteria bacterium]|nr:PadR family transcriptional regulator [Actinomycetota bacterium]MBU1944916.1 PadR family transcriptional regulator [Actinomycetota bacterium]MBU2688120.1 PadR family transcriptional regulator [Actinomycetota bacterium]